MKYWISDGEYDWDEEWDGFPETTSDDKWLLKEGWKHFPRTPEELKRENQPYSFEAYHRNLARKYEVNIDDWYQKVLRIKRIKRVKKRVGI
jgi:hypothetical protein